MYFGWDRTRILPRLADGGFSCETGRQITRHLQYKSYILTKKHELELELFRHGEGRSGGGRRDG